MVRGGLIGLAKEGNKFLRLQKQKKLPNRPARLSPVPRLPAPAQFQQNEWSVVEPSEERPLLPERTATPDANERIRWT